MVVSFLAAALASACTPAPLDVAPEPARSADGASAPDSPAGKPEPIEATADADGGPAAERPVQVDVPAPGPAVAQLAKAAGVLEAGRRAIPPQTPASPADILLRPPARLLLRRAKDAYLATLAARLAELDFTWPDAVLTSAASAAFGLAGLGEDAERVEVTVAKAAGHEGRVVAVFSMPIPCGSDSVLAVFARSPDARSRVRTELVVRADDYASIQDGRLGSDWAISPPDERGGWYLVTANARPWCTSAWRGIHYVAVAPAADPARPRVLTEYSGSARIGETIADLTAGSGELSIGFTSWDDLRIDVTRPYVHRFQVGSGGVARIAPTMGRPQDVLAEWLASDAAMARALTVDDVDARARLESRHRVLGGRRPDETVELRLDGRAAEPETDLPSPLKLELVCDACRTFPKRLAASLVREGAAWKLRSVEAASP